MFKKILLLLALSPALAFAQNSPFIRNDSASTTVQGTNIKPSLGATDSKGQLYVIQPSGSNLHVDVDSGTITPSGTQDVNITKVGGNAVTTTVPVSGTVSAAQSGSWTVTANQGGAPWQVQSNSANISTEATLAKLTQTQGSTTSGQSGPLIQGAVTTSAPTYSTGQTSPLSLTTSGSLRVDNSANTQPVSGTVTANQGGSPWGVYLVPQTSGGFTTYHLVSAASTNATNVKGSAGQLCGWYIYNNNAAVRKLALHNTAGTPTAGASVFMSIPVPPNGGANVFTETCIPFSTGIGITTVTGIADSDSTAVGANDLTINLYYK